MKKGYVYLIVSREDGTETPYHYHGVGDIVIYRGEMGIDDDKPCYRVYTKGNRRALFGQWVLPHHVFEIGKL